MNVFKALKGARETRRTIELNQLSQGKRLYCRHAAAVANASPNKMEFIAPIALPRTLRSSSTRVTGGGRG